MKTHAFSPPFFQNILLGRVNELRKMDKRSIFESKTGLLREAESRFDFRRTPFWGQKAALADFSKFVNTT